jgi:CheY-like chemotaxis protein
MKRDKIDVLLVEDNPDHAELLRREFEAFPFVCHLHHVTDGEAAIDYVFGRNRFASRGQFPAPDLMMLDLRLPRLDGMEVLRLVKTDPSVRNLPVIVLTTSDAERDVAAAIGRGADRFLTKPVEGAMLLQILMSYQTGQGSRNPGSPVETVRP